MSGPSAGASRRASAKTRSVGTALGMGLFSFGMHLIAALLGNSVTLISDLLRSTTDTLASLASYIAVRKVEQGKDAQFEFGYGKFENLAGLLVAGAMGVSCLIVFYGAVQRFRAPVVARGTEFGLIYAVGSLGLNARMWRHVYQLSRQESSPILDSQWRLFRMKCTANFCVATSLALGRFLRHVPGIAYVDPLTSLILAGFIGFSAYSVVSHTVYDLLDRALEENMQRIILRELATRFDEYEAFHGVRSRRSGGSVYIDIFLEFAGQRPMAEVQAVIDGMRESLERKIGNSHVIVAPTTAPVA